MQACEDLIQYGPLKPMHEQGYSEEELDKLAKSEEEEDVSKKEIIKNGVKMVIHPDPTGRRCGAACSDEYAEIVKKTLEEAQSIVSKVWNSQIRLNHVLGLCCSRSAYQKEGFRGYHFKY